MPAPMPRRHFLQLTATTLAAASLPLAASAAEETVPKKKRSIRKAIMGGTIGLKGSVLEKYQAIQAAGFEGVEPMSHMDTKEVLSALEATGLKAASVCCNTHWNLTLSHPSETTREKGLEGLKQALRDAKIYGATSVLLVPGTARDGVTYEQCWQRSIEQIRKAIPLAEESGVKIAIENVWNDFITDPKEAVRYLDEINSPQVMWHFDIGNIIWYGDPLDWIKALGARISRLHLKEYSRDLAMKKGRGAGFGVQFLDGANNWPAIMKALDEVGYQGWGITEQPGGQTHDAAALQEFSARVDRILAG
jgi:L-ribulose-5-phosphate 3-epimerase